MKEKFLRKIMAGATALCVLLGGTPGCIAEADAPAATSEGAETQADAQREAPEKEESTVAPTQAPTAAPTEAPTAEPTIAPTEAPTDAPTEEPTDVPTAEPTVAPTEAPAKAPTAKPTEIFVAGYAEVASKSKFYWENDEERTLDGLAVVFAFEYDEEKDRVHVFFNEDAQIQDAWVDASQLRLLDEKELQEYFEGDFEEALEWKELVLWPLTFKPEKTPAPERAQVSDAAADSAAEAVAGSADEGAPASSEDETADAPATGAEDSSADGAQSPSGSDSDDDARDPSASEAVDAAAEGAQSAAPSGNSEIAEGSVADAASVDGNGASASLMEIAVDVPLGSGTTKQAEAAMPVIEMDYMRECICVAAPMEAGTLRFLNAETGETVYEQEVAEACEIELTQLNGAPGSTEVKLSVEFAVEGKASATAELCIPARPEYVAETEMPQVEAGYTTAKITGGEGSVYALSLPDETEPGLFAVDGTVSGLTGGTSYAVWARNPAAEECFASVWMKLEGVVCETRVQTDATASFVGETIVSELRVEWQPSMPPFDPANGIFFQSEGASIDEAVAGNFSAQWRNELGEALETAPVDAGTYTLELTLTGEADRYALQETCLTYIIDPVDLSTVGTDRFQLFAGSRCVYNGEEQLPTGLRVELDGQELPTDSYSFARNGSANITNAGEACALIVGANANVTGQRAFAYRIEPRAVTVIPEQPLDFVYNGSVALSLTREGWALEGAVEGDVLTLDLTGAAATLDSADAGEGRAVRFEGVALAGADAANYVIGQIAECTVRVLPRAATIIAGSFEKTAGDADPSFTASTEGVLEGETLSYTFSRDKGENVGSYVIRVVPGQNPNYRVTTQNGQLTIRAKSINAETVTVSTIPRQIYTGSEIKPKPVIRDGSAILKENVDYKLEYHGNLNEGVATIDITGMGKYTGTRTVSFTIYMLSSYGGSGINNYGVEGELSGFEGLFGGTTASGADWESGTYSFLPQYRLLNNPLYDEYLGTGAGLEELNIVQNEIGEAQEYALVPIYTDVDPYAAPDAQTQDAAGTLLINAGTDESGEAGNRVFCFSGLQLARLYAERGITTLLLRNCETTLSLDVYEMISGDAARLVKMMGTGEANGDTALDMLDFDAMEEKALTTDELSSMCYELRTEVVELENGEPGYDLGVYISLNDTVLEVSGMLPSLAVGANVEGLFEEDEEDIFLEQYSNARMDENGEPEALEGEMAFWPEFLPDEQDDTATCYIATPGQAEEEPLIDVREEKDVQLDLYRCRTLVSPCAGPGLYLLLDNQAE